MTTITALPPAPLITDSQSAFNAKAFAFVVALSGFGPEANALAAEVNSDAAAAAASADVAVAAETGAVAAAQAASQSAGAVQWVSGATYAVGARVWSPLNFLPYRRRVAGAGTTDPSQDTTNWALSSASGLQLTVSNAAAVALAVNQHDVTTYAGVCAWTLPASPVVGDLCGVVVGNGRIDNTVARNGERIMGFLEDLVVDGRFASLELQFAGSTLGWRIV